MAGNLRRLILLLVAALLMGAPAAAQVQIENPADPFVHRQAGVAFGNKLGRFERGNIYEYDDQGADVSIAYHPEGVTSLVILTLYLYPAYGNCGDEFAGTLAAIADRPGSKQLRAEGPAMDIGLAGAETHFGRYSLPPDSFGIEHGEMYSDAWLFCPKGTNWLVKVRASYEAGLAIEHQQFAPDLVAQIDWRPLLEAP